jgi:competence protein ComEC
MQYLRSHVRMAVLSGAALITALFCFQYVHAHNDLAVAFLDVGQGDAVLIQSPSGRQVLYDAGPPSGAVLSGLDSMMPFYDRSLDAIILSHPDLDHTGGFPDVLRRYHVGLALEPGVFSGNGAYEAVESEITNSHVPRFLAKAGMTLDLGDGVKLHVLYPDRDVTGFDTNDASIVLLIEYGKTRVILSGDLPSAYEEQVVARYGKELHAQVLKLGHHGSRTSSSPTWLATVRPEIAVISRGIDNKYGHPHKEVLGQLAQLNIPFLDTAVQGSIVFHSDGEKFTQTN